MIAERAGLGEEVFERGLVVLLEVRRGPKSWVEIVLKVAAEVDLVEGVFFYASGLSGNLFCRTLPVAFESCALIERDDGLFELFENRVLDHLGVDHLPELELIEGKHTDHLHKTRGENLALRDFQIKLRLQQHVCLSIPSVTNLW